MSKEMLTSIAQESKLEKLPTIPKMVYSALNDLLYNGTCRFEDPREKDVYLISAMSVISGCMHNIHGLYHQQVIFPNQNAIVMAPAGCGEGIAKFARMLAEKHEEYLQKAGKQSCLLLPGNSSYAAIVQHLDEGKGIICESEADALMSAFKQDWGGYSEVFRKAFHHERISTGRKDACFNIKQPRLSVALCGTPDQVRAIIPGTLNGVFNCFNYYAFTGAVIWKDPSPREGDDFHTHDDFFSSLGEQVHDFAFYTMKHPARFSLKREQWEVFNSQLSIWLLELCKAYGRNAASAVKRLGLSIYKIAMTLAAIRKFEAGNTEGEFTCADVDFDTAMVLGSVFYQHLEYMCSTMPRSEMVGGDPILIKFYEALPEKFKRSEAIEVIIALGQSEESGDNYLKELCDINVLQSDRRSYYYKTIVT